MRLKGFRTTGGLILISRVLGFARDAVAARLLGASPAYDALLLAVTLPNLTRRLFGEGALTNALLPVYGRLQIKEQRKLLSAVTRRLLLFMAPATGAGVLLLLLLPATWTHLAALALPYGLFVCLAALFGGVLTVHGRFLPLGFVGIAFNLAWFAGLCFVWHTGGVWSVAAALPAGGLLALLIGLLHLRRVGVTLNIRESSPHLRAVLQGIAPPLIAGLLFLCSTLCDRAVAYSLAPAGGVSVLFLGERLFQLPLALIGIAGATALFAGLSAGRQGVLREAVQRVLPLSVAAAGGLFVVAAPAVALLFGGGRFDTTATERTAAIVSILALALPAYCLIHLMMRVHYSAHRGWRVVTSAGAALMLNLALSLLLVVRWGEQGVAAGTVVAAWFNAALLMLTLQRDERREIFEGLKAGRRGFAGAAAATALAALCIGEGFWGLLAGVAAGLSGYFGVAGVPSALQRRKQKEEEPQKAPLHR